MKNFKRVISAVIALTLSVSSFAMVSASKFSDVADTAAYAEAVEVLTALDIVHGYDEDGVVTFKPEGEITRAEAATMIVGALNMTDDATAAAGTSQFADVNTQASWASGYINVGVAQGFIAGMDATTFAPQENVTYAQMCVMLTSITGYGEYAAANGGWPTGYTTMAAQVGINKGVAVSNDTALTRGQVAQMIYNALVTPMLGVSEYSFQGNTYSQLDGKTVGSTTHEFKTLLSDKFDGYVVTGGFEYSDKSGLDTGKAMFVITKADWWDDRAISASDASYHILVYYDDIDVDANLLQVGKAIITVDDDDENHVVYFATTGKTEIKTFDAADYDDEVSVAEGKIQFDSKKYSLAANVSVYVNGESWGDFNINSGMPRANGLTDAQMLDAYLEKAVGDIKLIKQDGASYYSTIMFDVYAVAKVTSVTYKNGETTVDFTLKQEDAKKMTDVDGNETQVNYLGQSFRRIVVTDDAVEDEDILLNVKYNDNEIELKDLQKEDIIAFAISSENYLSGSITDPKFLTVLVSRDTLTAKATAKDTDEKTVTFDGTEYSFANWSKDGSGVVLKDTYEVTLDPFGRVFSLDQSASSKSYAILEKYTDSNDKIQLVLANGTTASYEYTVSKTDINNILYKNGKSADGKNDVIDRVVTYTLKNSTKEITAINAVKPNEINAEYNERTEKVGGASITDATNVIDATAYLNESSPKASDYKTYASFKDGVEYTGAYYKAAGSTVAGFVVLTGIGTDITGESRFAVVRKIAVEDTAEDGDDIYTMQVLYNGEETELAFEFDPSSIGEGDDLDVGDAFYFVLNGDGRIESKTDVYKIFDAAWDADNKSVEPRTNLDVISGAIKASDWTIGDYFAAAGADYQLVAGPITDVTGNKIEMAQVEYVSELFSDYHKIDLTLEKAKAGSDDYGYMTFGIADDCQAYVFDTKLNTSKQINKLYATSADSIIASNLDIFETGNKTSIYSDESTVESMIPYLVNAVAMVENGEVVCIYAIYTR